MVREKEKEEMKERKNEIGRKKKEHPNKRLTISVRGAHA